MPQINLSTLNGRELRQLLDASRRRGDASLSYQILQEMAARRERPAERGPFMMLRPTERRPVPAELAEPTEVEVGEPEDTDDVPPMPRWRPPAREPEHAGAPEPQAPAAETSVSAVRRGRRKNPAPEPVQAQIAEPADVAIAGEAEPPPLEPHRPLSLKDSDPQPGEDAAPDTEAATLRLHRAEPERPRGPRPPRFRLAAGFALGVTIGAALGWWAAGTVRDALPPPAPPAIQTAALTPAPTSAPVTPNAAEPAPDAAPDTTAGSPASDLPVAPIPPGDAQEAARDAAGEAIEPPPPPPPEAQGPEPVRPAETAQPAPERSARIAAKGCAAEPTPADRAICADPQLLRLQRELRSAYGKALEAHQDRALLRQHQLAWADARNSVSDRARLARLYAQRIRKLNAATAAARRER